MTDMLTGVSHKPYSSIENIAKLRAFFEGVDVVIQEKLDGANCAIQKTIDGQIIYQSRTQILDPTNPAGTFRRFIEWAESKRLEGAFDRIDGPWAVYGETLNTNKLRYEQNFPFVLFDINNFRSEPDSPKAYEDRLTWWATRLNVPAVAPTLYAGPFKGIADKLDELIQQSKFDSRADFFAEGIVIKGFNVPRWWNDRETQTRKTVIEPVMMAKHVREAFRESKGTPTSIKKVDDPIQLIVESFVTPARFDKVMQKAAEQGIDTSKAHQLIGLMGKDVHKEAADDIKDMLFRAYWKEINGRIAKLTLELHTQATAA